MRLPMRISQQSRQKELKSVFAEPPMCMRTMRIIADFTARLRLFARNSFSFMAILQTRVWNKSSNLLKVRLRAQNHTGQRCMWKNHIRMVSFRQFLRIQSSRMQAELRLIRTTVVGQRMPIRTIIIRHRRINVP